MGKKAFNLLVYHLTFIKESITRQGEVLVPYRLGMRRYGV